MRLREHPAVGEGRTDIRIVDPRQLSIIEGYNVRDLTTPEARAELDELKAMVKEHGVLEPVVVKFDGEKIWIVQGHRRHKVVMELIAEHQASGGAEGRNIEFIPFRQEPPGTTDQDREFGLETSNSGSRLKPLELANLIFRLHTGRGLPLERVAQGLGKSIDVVRNHLKLRSDLTDKLKDAVRSNSIAPTTAQKAVKELGEAGTLRLIEENAKQGRKTRPRDVHKAAGKGKGQPATTKPGHKSDLPPESKSDLPASAPPAPESDQAAAFQNGHAGTHEYTPPAEPAAATQPLPTDAEVPPAASEEEPPAGASGDPAQARSDAPAAPTNDPQGPFASAVEEPRALTPPLTHLTNGSFFKAAEPVAIAIEEGPDLAEFADDDFVGVQFKVSDLKRFLAAVNQARGG